MMLTRRRAMRWAAGMMPAVMLCGCATGDRRVAPAVVNDVHAQLNRTQVRAVTRPDSLPALRAALRDAGRQGAGVAIAGGRHAMGGQQFLDNGLLIDMRGMDRVLRFDRERGLVEVEAGIEWPALIGYLVAAQAGEPRPWGIAQKQTGADRLTIGGALAANVHGRGLAMQPIIGDVEDFTLVDAAGDVRRCSRAENAELFRLAIGGYGLFGVIATVTLRLVPRRKLERVVEILDVEQLMPAFERRIADGFLYGDWQYSTDAGSDGFLGRGVFSCYRPVDPARPVAADQKQLSAADWRRLIWLGHVDRAAAWDAYAGYYLSTSGQVYWSDTPQLSTYVHDYHRDLDRQLGQPASEMITEIYMPRPALAAFMAAAREDCRRHGVEVIYGTVRLIERDAESVLAWAREPWACVIFNLHVVHDKAGLAKASADFRRLIDRGIEHGGSYYLTYHRWAARSQVEACHPRFVEFLRAKIRHDPQERFQSDWYRHYRAMFGDAVG